MSNQQLLALVEIIRQKKLTIACAESCTGGLLSAAITELAGVSDVFVGSVICYANEVKTNVLGVSETVLKSKGAVSEEVAFEMAQGVKRLLKVGCALAITGVAGPSGGTVDKPVGTVCFAFLGPGFELTQTRQFKGKRRDIQNLSVVHAITELNNALRQLFEDQKK